jgi:putative transposase
VRIPTVSSPSPKSAGVVYNILECGGLTPLFPSATAVPMSMSNCNWPHAPPHSLSEQGAYMITCGTYQKLHHLNTPERLDMFTSRFLSCIHEADWELHAWAILSNHYHFIATSPTDPQSLKKTISKLHTLSARDLNLLDGLPGRKVWFQYFDSHITFTNSYLPRLKYVHNNPVHHGVVKNAENYQWCSAAWFASTAKPSFRKTVDGFKIDKLSVKDDF